MARFNELERSDRLFNNSRFRAGLTQKSGFVPARIIRARVIDNNILNGTVDVVTVYESTKWFDIPISSSYQHPNSGEGEFAMPEVGSTCHICLPSDGGLPFVFAFVMPVEIVPGTSQEQEQDQTDSASFTGGRPVAQAGDWMVRGRDGNFLILHRGGVLQVGSSSLNQRIFLPLGNLMMDISERYEMLNTGGQMHWGILEGQEDVERPGCQFQKTLRLYAPDKYADIRIRVGRVKEPMPEPSDGDRNGSSTLAGLGFDEQNVEVEMCLGDQAFDASSGVPVDIGARDRTPFRFAVDKNGALYLRTEASAFLNAKGPVRIKAQSLQIETKEGVQLKSEGMVLDGGAEAAIRGGVVRLGGGTSPVACVGDGVAITLPTVKVTGVLSGQPFEGVLTFLTPVPGVITSGRAQVLA